MKTFKQFISESLENVGRFDNVVGKMERLGLSTKTAKDIFHLVAVTTNKIVYLEKGGIISGDWDYGFHVRYVALKDEKTGESRLIIDSSPTWTSKNRNAKQKQIRDKLKKDVANLISKNVKLQSYGGADESGEITYSFKTK